VKDCLKAIEKVELLQGNTMLNSDLIKEYEALPYRMEVFFDAESEVWVVRYPELPGCTAHGDTPEEAMALGKDVKALWIETALEEHQTIPRPLGEPGYSGSPSNDQSKRIKRAKFQRE
jgi:predicted RNase H-like HicB family nuclease